MIKFDFYKDVLYRFIREKLKNNPKMNYFQRVWRHRNDEKSTLNESGKGIFLLRNGLTQRVSQLEA